MAIFLTVKSATDRVVGYTRNGADNPPADTADTRYVARTESELQEYFVLRRQAASEGRRAHIEEIAGVVALVADARPRFDVTASKREMDADGVDVITLTWQRIQPNGDNNINFDGSLKVNLWDRYIKLEFTSGVALYAFKTLESGIYEVIANNDYRVRSGVMVEAFA